MADPTSLGHAGGPGSGRPAPARAAPSAVAMLVLDVDGVLTDGGILLDDAGNESKRFFVQDGFALRLCEKMGLALAVITGRRSDVVFHRLADLRVRWVYQGSSDKAADLARLAAESCIEPARMAFLGDDWPDLPALRRVGYPMAVANATEPVKAAAAFVTTRPGGHGAVREAVEHLLAARGQLNDALRLYDR
jgi:3-deoxy-D-manno-octulosonate 8-phosphate phosphatase (KDO 8-P phosphatase)